VVSDLEKRMRQHGYSDFVDFEFQRECDLQDDLERLRRVLSDNPPDVGVRMSCVSRRDAEWIEARLTPEERARVIFTWILS